MSGLYQIDNEDILCFLNLKYKSVPCSACQGRGFEYVDPDGCVHQSKLGHEGTWYYDIMEQPCEDCAGLGFRIVLDNGTIFGFN